MGWSAKSVDFAFDADFFGKPITNVNAIDRAVTHFPDHMKQQPMFIL
jgi:hypothetical protein